MISLLLSLVMSSMAAEVTPEIPNMLKAAEIKYDLPEGVLSAIAHVESSTNPKAFVKEDGKSKHSSFGLLQIQYASAKLVGFKGNHKDLMKPEINIEYGAKYLRWLLQNHEFDVSWTLTCWNAGPSSKLCRSRIYSKYVGAIFNAFIDKK